ncbi:hypothetical protein OG500_03170 [Kitasatospora sp. NBC_01250]|uniref:hypothetical protein n=1 Tax=unclassified Kitasatospora TaxID=2633591 RepID=UPI002E0E5C5C|nr:MULTISPECIES: hypothetical protein [unclassified Kitasatospora]WSJ65170.1 hypothetical protein OG294_03135 [Kitasatospora sp. NBC_01302]
MTSPGQPPAEVLAAEWTALRAGFVDDPRAAVRRADELSGRAITALNHTLEDRRRRLRALVERPGVDTESLRLALQGYAALVDQLPAEREAGRAAPEADGAPAPYTPQ